MLGAGADGASSGCSSAAELVYVVSEESDLYSFKPDTLSFTKIGAVACPAGGALPNSMAVDRSGTAWVNYTDGALYKVSTADASCVATTFAPGQHGFTRFGMAFTSNSPGSSDETLFVSGITDGAMGAPMGKGIATINLGTMALTPIGDFSGALTGQGAELTGTGDARLFGFFTTKPATLAEINNKSAATPMPQSLTNVNTGSAWAFSFWGGDFWFYTADVTMNPSHTGTKQSDGRVHALELFCMGVVSNLSYESWRDTVVVLT